MNRARQISGMTPREIKRAHSRPMVPDASFMPAPRGAAEGSRGPASPDEIGTKRSPREVVEEEMHSGRGAGRAGSGAPLGRIPGGARYRGRAAAASPPATFQCPSGAQTGHRLNRRIPHRGERGAVLLLVLWLTAALSFVALSMALSARTELTATSYRLHSEQARFLARGALEQAIHVVFRDSSLQDAREQPLYDPERPYLDFAYETGAARVALIPETGRIDVNRAPVETLERLLEVAGVEGGEAREIAAAIADWRGGVISDAGTAFDGFYRSLAPPYSAPHRPLTRLEELLLVKGMTPELYYGWLERDASGALVRRGALARALTVYGGGPPVNANFAPFEVLRALPGIDAETAAAIVARRRDRFYQSAADLPLRVRPESVPLLAFGTSATVMTLLATGQPHGSAVKASVRAVVQRNFAAGAQVQLLAYEEMAVAEEAFEVEARSQGSQEPE